MLETKHLTVEEFDEWVLLPENRDCRLEYVAGEVVELVWMHSFGFRLAVKDVFPE